MAQPEINTNALVTAIQGLVPARPGGTNELQRSDQTIPEQALENQALYNVLNQANIRQGQMGAGNREAQPIVGDVSNILDKQIIKLNNYIQSVTNPDAYLRTRLRELAKIRAYIKDIKAYYVQKFLRLGYSESESISMATALTNPILQAELKIYEDMLPDKLTDLALQMKRQTQQVEGMTTGQERLRAGQAMIGMGM